MDGGSGKGEKGRGVARKKGEKDRKGRKKKSRNEEKRWG